MQFLVDFDAREFAWTWPSAKRVVDMIRKAGKMDEFKEALDDWFHGDHPTSDDIQEHVASSSKSILNRIGLDENGNRLDRKKFKVFYRITGTGSEEIEAETPEEARDKFIEEFWDSPGDPLLCIERSDVESVTPVCYDCGDGDTKDYEFSGDHEKDLGNTSPKHEMFALVKISQEDSGHILRPEVKFFMEIERARSLMKFEFDAWFHACGEEAYMYQEPTDGIDTCYVNCKDGTFARWFIVKSKAEM